MAEAINVTDPATREVVAPEALTSGEIIQDTDGKAGLYLGLNAASSGDTVVIAKSGRFNVTKIATKVVLAGGKLYWDRSASSATPIKTADSFFIGTAVEDVASATALVEVDLNAEPANVIELGKGEWTEAETDGLGAVAMAGGSEVKLAFDAVAEAAMAALYSADTVPCADGPIFEAQVAIYDIGDDGALDINFGLANGTHASDFDSVTEAVVFHLDGSALSIFIESDDGTTEVAATDSTIDAVDDTYFEVWIDARVLTDVKMYVDGVETSDGETKKLDAATGPLLAIFHIEKTSNDTLADVRVKRCEVRTTDLA